jgi:hypothetical protein
MKPYEIKMETDGGPWVSHDYPCPVYSHLNSVYDMDKGIFQPSWVAQERGWHLIKTDTWFKRVIFDLVFRRKY